MVYLQLTKSSGGIRQGRPNPHCQDDYYFYLTEKRGILVIEGFSALSILYRISPCRRKRTPISPVLTDFLPLGLLKQYHKHNVALPAWWRRTKKLIVPDLNEMTTSRNYEVTHNSWKSIHWWIINLFHCHGAMMSRQSSSWIPNADKKHIFLLKEKKTDFFLFHFIFICWIK